MFIEISMENFHRKSKKKTPLNDSKAAFIRSSSKTKNYTCRLTGP